MVFCWLPNLSVVNRSLAHYYACPLIGRYLDSRVFIGSLSTNHHEECIKICQVLLQVIQDESRDTLCIRQQLDNRRGLTDVSQKTKFRYPFSRLLRTFSYSCKFEIHTYHTPRSFKTRIHALPADVSGTSELHNNVCAWNTSALQFQHSEGWTTKTFVYDIRFN